MDFARYYEVFLRQAGVARSSQLTELGLSRHTQRRLVQAGRLERVTSRVLRLPGAAATDEQRLWTAVLHLGERTVVSHVSALMAWNIMTKGLHGLHVTMPGRAHDRELPAIAVHRPHLFRASDVATRAGLPITSPERTLFDVAGVLHPGRTERAVDNALGMHLASLTRLHAMLDELAARGRPGIRAMRAILAERPDGYVPTASELEALLEKVLKRFGLPMPARQIDVGVDYWVGRVDFAYREQRILIEVDGSLHHSTLLDRKRDKKRARELTAAGWTIFQIRWEELRNHPHEVARSIRVALEAAA